MLTLYVKKTCAFCHKVRVFAVASGLEVEYKDIYADPAIATELVEKGGKRQVPFLVDDAKGVAMYESEDIIKYLEDHYAH